MVDGLRGKGKRCHIVSVHTQSFNSFLCYQAPGNTVTISSLLTHWTIPDTAVWPLPVTQKCLSKKQ